MSAENQVGEHTPSLEHGGSASHAVDSHPGGDLEAHHGEHEKPEDWGWHHDFTVGRQIGGWSCVVVLALYLTGWHYNHTGTLAIVLIMIALVGGLLWDRRRRRTQWRQ